MSYMNSALGFLFFNWSVMSDNHPKTLFSILVISTHCPGALVCCGPPIFSSYFWSLAPIWK